MYIYSAVNPRINDPDLPNFTMFEGQKFGGMKNSTLKKEFLTGFTTPST